MRTMKLVFAAFCATALFATVVVAQEVIIRGGPGQMPTQIGGPRQMKPGTGRILGRVVASDTGSPVRRAQIRLSGPEGLPRAALTDVDGRYEFRELPPGRYNLTAQKPGFMTVQYGQTRPFELGKSIELSDGQVADKIVIAMPRGSAISGRIADEFGDPVADATVTALRSVWRNGMRRLEAAGRTAQTNDLGQFRIFGLAPGDYYVSATFRGGDIAMMDMAMMATMTGGSGGGSGSAPNSGYAATYYPGTTNGADAQRMTLTVGQEAQGIDFSLIAVRLSKITGMVIGSDGKPVDGTMVTALPRMAAGAMIVGPGNTGRTDRNGAFTISNLPPGDYTLQTRGNVQMFVSSSGNETVVNMTRVVGPNGPTGGGEPEYGSVPVSLAGEDVSNVVILTTKGTTGSGRLVFEGGAVPPGASSVRILATPADTDMSLPGGAPASVAADGTFQLRGLSGSRILRVIGLPQGWVLKGVRAGGQDVTDSGIEFKGEPVTGIEVVATNKVTEVNGTVQDASGSQVKDYTVVVFSDDPQKWTAPGDRHVTGVRPDTDGRYRVRNLPPGGYYAIALEYIAQGEWGDPELLQRLSSRATRVELGEGETRTLDLRIGS